MNINGEGKGGDDNEKNGGEEEGKWGAGGAEKENGGARMSQHFQFLTIFLQLFL